MRWIFFILICVSLLFGSSKRDSSTGLMWQDNNDARTLKLNWRDAMEYCQELTLDGYSDWRLPSIKELQTLVDVSKYKPAIKSGLKNTNNTHIYGTWSSTTYVGKTSMAWFIIFLEGGSCFAYKSETNYVRCVRSGQ